MKIRKNRLILIVVLSLAINVTWADSSFRIVTDPWPPYAYIDDNIAVGIDVDIALAVLDKMGITGRIEMLPWKRSLVLVKNLEADAILSAAMTDARKSFLHFPTEPVSKGDTVFFKRKQRKIVLNNLDNLNGLKVGTMLGYKYCKKLDESPLLLGASRVATLEQSFNMLMSGRIDALVEVDAVGIYKAKEMGITDEISIIKGSRYCTVGNHLAFSKKPDRDVIASEFSKELVLFKQTQQYRDILEKYGMAVQ